MIGWLISLAGVYIGVCSYFAARPEAPRRRVSRRDEFCTEDPTAVGIWHVGD